MDRLNRSLPVDRRLWREDVRGSRAWAKALGRAGVITEVEAAELVTGLDAVGDRIGQWSNEEWEHLTDEDIHSLVERLLREQVGATAGKLHTGRSRNDQVATDTRLWAIEAIDRISALLRDLETALVDQAEQHVGTVMPSYTHLQRAQPISVAQWLLSHAWPLERDRQRFADARKRTAILPLGSGAVAGCPFPVDRDFLRDELGFLEISPNSIDAVSDRDWLAELLFVSASLGVHLSRIAEDFILFTSAEFGFVRLSDQYSTGSSLMPQKRNPDVMELARGKAGRLMGSLVGILTTLKGLPTGYNKDLQEDKTSLFETADTLETLLPAMRGAVTSMRVDGKRTEAAIDPAMFATDLAEFLVRRGLPFRDAHERVGRLVKLAEEQGVRLNELGGQAFSGVAAEFGETEVEGLFDPLTSVDSRASVGGTARESVRAQIDSLRQKLDSD